jgi:hypothetical protein
LAVPGLLGLALLLPMSAAVLAGGPGGGGGGAGGGGGGGGGGRNTNPFIGSWRGSGAENNSFAFTFTKDFQFTMTEVDESTGVQVVTNLSGTYALGGVGPNGFPLITMFSGGKVVLVEEYESPGEGTVLNGTIYAIIGRL